MYRSESASNSSESASLCKMTVWKKNSLNNRLNNKKKNKLCKYDKILFCVMKKQ